MVATATVLFTDLVGSTEWRGRLGEPAANDVRRAHDRLLVQAVEANGGQVVKGLGDGIMATFTGASAAVAAAVAMQQGLDRLNRSGRTPVPLSVRIGLSTGDATFEEGDVHGTPVVEASRLCAAAAGGEILVTELVRGIAGSNTASPFEPVGPLALKGLPVPVPTLRVTWEPAAVTIPMPPLLTEVSGTFVGRTEELERLAQLWKAAAAGERRVAFLTGEPGVGKTRLAAELAMRVRAEGGTVLAGRCDEDLGIPYQPFVEALRHFVDHTSPGDLPERLGHQGGELVRLLPELADLVSDLPAPLRSDPETERYRLFEAVVAWLAEAARDDPLLLVLDDLQWAAKPTLLLLRHAVRFSDPVRLLILGTYRDRELVNEHPLAETLADLRRSTAIAPLSLGGLDESHVGEFFDQVTGGALDHDKRTLTRAIYDETDGNPFFVKEVLRHLMETESPGQRALPEGVRAVVGRRLSRLSAGSNAVLRTAAVIGAEFEPALVETAGGFTPDEVIVGLEEAATGSLVLEAAAGRYRFAHALVRDAVYQSLSAVRREAVHLRVAEALETLHGAGRGPRVAEIARHRLAGNQPAAVARTIDATRWAGEVALDRLAPEEAVDWFSTALELAREQAGTDDVGSAELLLGLGRAQLFAGDEAHRETLLAAARLARRSGANDVLVRAALANTRGTHSRSGWVDTDKTAVLEAALEVTTGETAERALLLAMFAVELTFAGQWAERRRLAEEALTLARRLDDPATVVNVGNLVYLALSVPETLDERQALTAETVSRARQLGDPSSYHFACRFRCYACADGGDLEGFDTYLTEATRAAETAGEPSLRWVMTFVRACRALLAGDVEDAEHLANEALQLGTESGQPDALPIFASGLLEIRRHQGRLGEMEPVLVQAMADNPGLSMLRAKLAGLYCETGTENEARRLLAEDAGTGFAAIPRDVTWLRCMTVYAEVAARLHDVQAAASLYEQLGSWHSQVAFMFCDTGGAVAHYLGMLAAVLGRTEAAEAHFREALEIHRRLRAPYWIASTQIEWARLLALPGAVLSDHTDALLREASQTADDFNFSELRRRSEVLLGR